MNPTQPATAAPEGAPTPTTPQPVGLADCQPMLDLLAHLCSAHPDPDAAYRWLLRWIAYPVQQPGARTGRVVLMSGPQGCGKSAFWNAIRQMYGAAAVHLDPSDIESPFNAWALGRSLIVVDGIDEVYLRAAQRLVAMINAPTWVIDQKHQPRLEVPNNANFVLLANAPGALPISPGDRRYFVCAAPELQDPAAINRVHDCLMADGISALRDYLLRLPLGDFGPHTPPPNAQSTGDTP